MQWNIGPIEGSSADELLDAVKARWRDDYAGRAPGETAKQFDAVIGCLEHQLHDGVFGAAPYTCAIAGQTGDGPTVFNLHVLSGERMTAERFLDETARSDTRELVAAG